MAQKAIETKRAKTVKVNPDEVTFGVEIECYLKNEVVHRLGINVGEYHHPLPLPFPFPSFWEVAQDASLKLKEDDPRRYTHVPMEIISPPLKGLDGLRMVERVCDILEENRAMFLETCGIHVHVGMRSILGEQSENFEVVAEWVRRLLHLCAKHETALYALTGTHTRIKNPFADSVKALWEDKATGRLTWKRLRDSYPERGFGYTYEEREERMKTWRQHRYRLLNLANLFESKATVEFRCFSGTSTGVKVVGYILAALGLSVKAAENTSAVKWDAEETVKTSHVKYYQNRVRHLHDRLAWMDAPSRVKCGYPKGAWEVYGRKVKKNQIWNAQHLAEKIKAIESGAA